ncbi:unnamed protein product [Oikopleura dioica]|uniref:Uncharacterized protein n=1 Tax=Oikopleura dioica TaxID=34765 RepID=E4XEW4_OIKDI|nr:unnamed protein product [Oikopleura dioica]
MSTQKPQSKQQVQSEPLTGEEEPAGFGVVKTRSKKTDHSAITYNIFLSCQTGVSEGDWQRTITKERFHDILEGVERVLKAADFCCIFGEPIEITDPDITRYCRVTYRDCFLRPGREFYPTARKLREKIFLSRYYLLREFEGLTIKRDEYSDIPEARESALRFKQFMKCCTPGKINLIKALETLRQLADKKEKLPKSALEACKRLEGALLFLEPPVIPIPIAVFHPDILQNSIIGFLLDLIFRPVEEKLLKVTQQVSCITECFYGQKATLK